MGRRKRDRQDRQIAELTLAVDQLVTDAHHLTGVRPATSRLDGDQGGVIASGLGSAVLAELRNPAVPRYIGDAAHRIGVDLAKGVPMNHDGAAGMATLLRGSVGEIETLRGIQAGTIPMPPGARAAVLGDFRQPALDLRFLDAQGHAIADTANVKIGTSFGVVSEHLRAHPQVRVLYVSHELAEQAAARHLSVVQMHDPWPRRGPVFVDTHLRAADLHQRIEHAIARDGATWIEILDVFPIVSAGIITTRYILDRRNTDLTVNDAKERAVDRSVVSMATWITARTLFHLGLGGPALAAVAVAEGVVVGTFVAGVRARAVRTAELRSFATLLEAT